MNSLLYFFIYVFSVCVALENLQSARPRIIAGQEASPGQFPWQAAIHISRGNSISYCGGSIISNEWILTAAQCLDSVDSMEIYTGSVKLSEGVSSQAAEAVLHVNYDPSTLVNDIGLIKLRQPLTFDEETSAITLAQSFLQPGVDVTVSGWGATSNGGTSNAHASPDLQYALLTTVLDSECGQVFGDYHNYDGMLCAVSGTIVTSGPCNGDIGDPLVANIETSATLVGFFSFGSERCGGGYPFGFTRISPYRDWIQAFTGI